MTAFTDTVLQWFSSYLTDHTQYVFLTKYCSTFTLLHSGIPQVSVLGPMFFSMCINLLHTIIDSHYITQHLFAVDFQLQMSAPRSKNIHYVVMY